MKRAAPWGRSRFSAPFDARASEVEVDPTAPAAAPAIRVVASVIATAAAPAACTGRRRRGSKSGHGRSARDAECRRADGSDGRGAISDHHHDNRHATDHRTPQPFGCPCAESFRFRRYALVLSSSHILHFTAFLHLSRAWPCGRLTPFKRRQARAGKGSLNYRVSYRVNDQTRRRVRCCRSLSIAG